MNYISLLRNCERREGENETIFCQKQKTPTKPHSPSLFYFTIFVIIDRNSKFTPPPTHTHTHTHAFAVNQICLTFIFYVHGSQLLNIITEVFLDGSTNTQSSENSLTYMRIDGRNSRKKWLSETLTPKTCHKNKAAHVYKIYRQH